jgi:hypothetical protein
MRDIRVIVLNYKRQDNVNKDCTGATKLFSYYSC